MLKIKIHQTSAYFFVVEDHVNLSFRNYHLSSCILQGLWCLHALYMWGFLEGDLIRHCSSPYFSQNGLNSGGFRARLELTNFFRDST